MLLVVLLADDLSVGSRSVSLDVIQRPDLVIRVSEHIDVGGLEFTNHNVASNSL